MSAFVYYLSDAEADAPAVILPEQDATAVTEMKWRFRLVPPELFSLETEGAHGVQVLAIDSDLEGGPRWGLQSGAAALQNKIYRVTASSVGQPKSVIHKYEISDEIWVRYGERAELALSRLLPKLGARTRCIAYLSDGALVLDIGEPGHALTLIFTAEETRALYRLAPDSYELSDSSLGIFPTNSELAALAFGFNRATRWTTRVPGKLRSTNSSVAAFFGVEAAGSLTT